MTQKTCLKVIQRLAIALFAAAATGCDAPAMAPSPAGPVIRDLQLSHGRIIGAEAFSVTVVVDVPVGKYVKAVGIRTPYEQTIQPLDRPLPMAIANGWVNIRTVQFQALPVAGPYPLEVWLINEAGQPSNRVTGLVHVQ